jgi:two-component system, LytTR family, response regulator
MRVIIADDDKSMRFVLRKALEKNSQITIGCEVQNGAEAVSAFENDTFDAAFLDVDMPVLDGIEAAKLILDINPKCIIVFITAHEEYMQEAFELYAFDYMVKPFKLERFNQTIQRMLEFKQVMGKTSSNQVKVEATNSDLLLKVKEGMVVVRPEDILMIERENRSSIIITEKEHYSINKTLSELEAILPADEFIRAHKSYIIRLDKIDKMSIYGRWTYLVKLKGTKKDALLTKEKAKVLETLFKSY